MTDDAKQFDNFRIAPLDLAFRVLDNSDLMCHSSLLLVRVIIAQKGCKQSLEKDSRYNVVTYPAFWTVSIA